MKHNATKIISIIMVLILLLGAFVGCGDQDSTTLSDKKREKLEKDWFEIEGKPIEWWDYENGQYEGTRYYGTFNGYIVFFTEVIGLTASEGLRIVGEFDFRHPEHFEIYAYKKGEFYSLADAHKDGLLTDEQIEEIFNIHWHKYQKQVLPLFYERYEVLMNVDIPSTYVPPIGKEYLQEIESKWLEKFGYEIKWRDIANGQYNGAGYCGTHNDCFIIFEATDQIESADYFLSVGKCRFVYPEKFIYLAYKDGEFYSLYDAYWGGLLREKDIEYLFEKHNDRMKIIYPEFYRQNYEKQKMKGKENDE